jgi:hypothetical protein
MSEIKRLPGETKEDARLRAQQEWLAAQPERRRKEDGAMRKLHDLLQFWKFCPHKRCRHLSRCSGDARQCFNRFWPRVPEEVKVEIRAAIVARAGGMSVAEAARHGRDERVRYVELEARFAREKEEPDAAATQRVAPPQSRTIPDGLAPRIRPW